MPLYNAPASDSHTTSIACGPPETPAAIVVACEALQAEGDLTGLWMNVITCGPPEYEKRITKVWSAWLQHRPRLTSKRRSDRTRLEGRMCNVVPIPGFGSSGWAWDPTTISRIDGIVHRIVRSIMGCGKTEEEGWLSWHTRTLREARQWVIGLLGCTCAEWLLRNGATKWEERLQWDATTFISHMIGWQSAAHYAWETALVHHIGTREGTWRRERIGRPPQ